MSTRNGLSGLAVGLLGIAAGYVIYKAVSSQNRAQERVQKSLPSSDGRDFAVMYSAFDSPFRHVGADPDKPQAPYKTLKEALAVAERWEATAQQVNGKAQVINVRTGEVVSTAKQSA